MDEENPKSENVGKGEETRDEEESAEEPSVVRVCVEYKESVRMTLVLINETLGKSLEENYANLEALGDKIDAYNRRMDENPNVGVLPARHKFPSVEDIREFDEIKINLKENARRITEKLHSIEKSHKKLLRSLLSTARSEGHDEDENAVKDQPCDDKEAQKDPETKKLLEQFKSEKLDFDTMSKGSFDRVTICRLDSKRDIPDSDSSVASKDNPIKTSRANIEPDVQRGKPFEDIHRKLVQQLEATDSLEGFLRLLERKPNADCPEGLRRKRAKTKSKIVPDKALEKKYAGSLWFFHNKIKQKAGEKAKRPPTARSSSSQKSAVAASSTTTNLKTPAKRKTVSACACNLLVHSTVFPATNEDKAKKMKAEIGRTKLKYYDLLDDLHSKDLEPIKSEYPRRDNIPNEADKADETYLHKIMNENDKVWKQLLQPTTSAKQRKIKNRNVKNLMAYLTEPQRRVFPQQNLVVLPVKVFYDNCPTRESQEEEGEEFKRECSMTVTELKDQLSSFDQKAHFFMTDLTKMHRKLPVIQESQDKIAPSPKAAETGRKPPPPPPPLPPTTPEAKARAALPPPRESKLKLPPTWHPTVEARCRAVLPPHREELKFRSSPPASPSTTEARPPPMARKRVMLEHLKGLKARNDNIQKNIQKAIDVIETKMLDILSSPSDSKSTEAFNVMEKEITKVLRMMNDGERREAKIDDIEPEKDENHRAKRPVSRKPIQKDSGILDFVPGVDLEVIPVRNEAGDTKIETGGQSQPKKATGNIGDQAATGGPDLGGGGNGNKPEQAKNEASPEKTGAVEKKSPKAKSDKKAGNKADKSTSKGAIDKRAANIAESEKLLGQVDNVIKKIDNIYTKFYDSKNAKALGGRTEGSQDGRSYNNVIEFLDNLKSITGESPVVSECQMVGKIAHQFDQARCFHVSSVYYEKKLAEKGDSSCEEEYEEIERVDSDLEFKIDARMHALNELRHEMALKTFYTLFFSTIFVALNLDYTC